jgi:hypothetical protein
MTFILSEDNALRKLLQGITVTDQKSETDDLPRPVGVWFGQPDQEIRSQSYPYMVIDLIDVQRDASREHRGKTHAEYLRDDTVPAESDFETTLPIPVNLDYQITTFARHPQHDRQLLSQLLHTRLPFRFGTLLVNDNTVRRLDVLDVTKRDSTEQAKRLFMNSITVRVSSEILQTQLKQLYKVLEVHVDDPSPENIGGRTSMPGFEGVGSFVIRP